MGRLPTDRCYRRHRPAQIAVVWFGIRVVRQAGERRAKEQDQRHDETMLALRELIARTGRSEPAS